MIQVVKKTKRQYNTKLLDWKKNNEYDLSDLIDKIDDYSKNIINYAEMKKQMESLLDSFESVISNYEQLYSDTLEVYNKSRGIV